jgi:hypothetical protein
MTWSPAQLASAVPVNALLGNERMHSSPTANTTFTNKHSVPTVCRIHPGSTDYWRKTTGRLSVSRQRSISHKFFARNMPRVCAPRALAQSIMSAIHHLCNKASYGKAKFPSISISLLTSSVDLFLTYPEGASKILGFRKYSSACLSTAIAMSCSGAISLNFRHSPSVTASRV